MEGGLVEVKRVLFPGFEVASCREEEMMMEKVELAAGICCPLHKQSAGKDRRRLR